MSNVICKIKVGDRLRVKDFWGPKLGGKECTALEIIGPYRGCESGYMIRINIYDSPLDANWFDLLPPKERGHSTNDNVRERTRKKTN